MKISGLTKRYKNTLALDNINLELEEGKATAVLGESGAGKTTLLNLLGGMDGVTDGKLYVGEEDVSAYNKKQLTEYRRHSVGFVFQFYNLMPNLTALENVEIAVEICKDHLDPKQILTEVGLDERLNNFPAQLSGGEQQRVAIARALVNKPAILLADEPTGNLDPKNSWEIMKLLEQINESGTTVIVVTHNREIVNAMQKRVVTLKKGVIVSDEEKGGYIDED